MEGHYYPTDGPMVRLLEAVVEYPNSLLGKVLVTAMVLLSIVGDQILEEAMREYLEE